MYSRIHIGRKEKEINHKNRCNKVEQKVRNDQLLNDFQISSSRFAIIFLRKDGCILITKQKIIILN